MSLYLRALAFKVVGVFVGVLVSMATASQPFNVLTFDWTAALTVAGSLAFLALLDGVAGRFTGDKDQPTITR